MQQPMSRGVVLEADDAASQAQGSDFIIISIIIDTVA